MKADRLYRVRKIFGVVFVIALLSSVILYFALGPMIGNVFSTINNSLCATGPDSSCPPPDIAQQQPSPASDMAALGFATTAITAVTSLLGFVSTSVLGWRKDKREAQLADLDRKRLEIELEKQRLELDEMKKKDSQS